LGVQPPEIVQRWAQKSAEAPPPSKIIRLAPLPILLEQALLKLGARPPALLRRWASYAKLPPLARAYNEINRALARLGRRPDAVATPIERAAALTSVVPPAQEPAGHLVQEYQIETFSPRAANLLLAQESAKIIRSLSYREFLHRLLGRLQRRDDQRGLRRLSK
jgi:hypothetical protein